MRFEFATANRILFAAGALAQVAPLAAEMGHHALVVTGSSAGRAASLVERLHGAGVETTLFGVSGEPTVQVVEAGVAHARAAHCDLVIGMGGGSALDTGKAIAAMLTNPGTLLDYLEVIGRGQALRMAPAPYIAIPTTAGTGSEVTRNAVLASPERNVKVSLRSSLMLPRLAVVDPELTLSAPPAVTASTGLDALTQLVEPYVCNRPTPITDALCLDGMARIARSLRRAYADGIDMAAREDLALASLYGGMALANAKLGAVHGLAGPLGGMFPAPHGAICARLLPIVTDTNVQALAARDPESPVIERYRQVARVLTGDPAATIAAGVSWLDALSRDLAIPPLSHYGFTPSDIDRVVPQALKASSMKGNPIPLTDREIADILARGQ